MQSFQMRPEVEIFPLYFPGFVFSRPMHVWRNIFGIGTPVVGMIKGDGEDFKQTPERQEILIPSLAVVPGQYAPAPPFNGIPGPSLIAFVTHKTPEFIHLPVETYFNLQLLQSVRFLLP